LLCEKKMRLSKLRALLSTHLGLALLNSVTFSSDDNIINLCAIVMQIGVMVMNKE